MNAYRSLQRRRNMNQEVRPAFGKMRMVYGVHLENAPLSEGKKPVKVADQSSPRYKPTVRQFSFWEVHYDLFILAGLMMLVGSLLVILGKATLLNF